MRGEGRCGWWKEEEEGSGARLLPLKPGLGGKRSQRKRERKMEGEGEDIERRKKSAAEKVVKKIMEKVRIGKI